MTPFTSSEYDFVAETRMRVARKKRNRTLTKLSILALIVGLIVWIVSAIA
jgi:hypothetical protein